MNILRKDGDHRLVVIGPGELYVGSGPLVCTVLGPCVSVVMYSPEVGAGGICHAMLPGLAAWGGGRRADVSPPRGFRYVDVSMDHLLRSLKGLGAEPSELDVMVFGGASMLVRDKPDAVRHRVGESNVERALAVVEERGLRLVRRDTGGRLARKVLFHTDTGEVSARPVRKGRRGGARAG